MYQTFFFGGGGVYTVVFKKNKLLGKTTQNIGKELKKKNYMQIIGT